MAKPPCRWAHNLAQSLVKSVVVTIGGEFYAGAALCGACGQLCQYQHLCQCGAQPPLVPDKYVPKEFRQLWRELRP